MDTSDHKSFKDKLDKAHQWPSLYMFKFIVPNDKVEPVKRLFPKNILKEKPSKTGKYISVTAEIMVSSSEQVIQIYEDASKVDGLIAL